MSGRWVTAAAVAGLLSACGSSSPTSTAQAPAAPAQAHGQPIKPVRTHRPRSALPPAANGSLPQTPQRPSATTSTFAAEMAALWTGVRTDSVHAAMPAFFPEAAYAQVKAIADPEGDWQARLVGNFALDLRAAHRLLGPTALHARLVAVDVPADYVHWVAPGACYNRLGYWEVPNSRLVYRVGDQVRSFGIASMISWRGIWYVVHLGSVSGGGGVLDDPEPGRGSPAPSSTC